MSDDFFSDSGGEIDVPHTPKSAYNEGLLDEAKRLLLEEAAEKPVQRLLQVDGHRAEPDSVMDPDEDGHDLMAGETYELRKSGDFVPVRVHIHEAADKAEVVAMLRKITAWLEKDFDGLRAGVLGESDQLPDDKPRLRRIK